MILGTLVMFACLKILGLSYWWAIPALVIDAVVHILMEADRKKYP